MTSNTNNELFELCKSVYDRFPKWWDAPFTFELDDGDNTGYIRANIGSGQIAEWLFKPDPINKQPAAFLPLYTSDYLLKKLPRSIKDGSDFIWAWLSMDNLGDDGWQYGYRKGAAKPLIATTADTPLKALLKLTIALHEAGDL